MNWWAIIRDLCLIILITRNLRLFYPSNFGNLEFLMMLHILWKNGMKLHILKIKKMKLFFFV